MRCQSTNLGISNSPTAMLLNYNDLVNIWIKSLSLYHNFYDCWLCIYSKTITGWWKEDNNTSHHRNMVAAVGCGDVMLPCNACVRSPLLCANAAHTIAHQYPHTAWRAHKLYVLEKLKCNHFWMQRQSTNSGSSDSPTTMSLNNNDHVNIWIKSLSLYHNYYMIVDCVFILKPSLADERKITALVIIVTWWQRWDVAMLCFHVMLVYALLYCVLMLRVPLRVNILTQREGRINFMFLRN